MTTVDPGPGGSLGRVGDEVEAALGRLAEKDAVARLWSRDHTLWQDDPTEVADRLGWLDLPATAHASLDRLTAIAANAREDGATRAVVLGMGGSSLFPLVLADLYGDAGGLRLDVLDSVDPAAIRRVLDATPPEETVVVASSKSGTTAETRTLLEAFWERSGDGSAFVAVTDPGTPLATLGRERGFRAVVEAPPDVGGRFSALTPFGLVPGALAGADLAPLLASARAMADACRKPDGPGAELAAVLAGAARAGRDKLTLVLPDEAATFGAWVEQLVAESTGKDGAGILPVVGEPVGPPDVYGPDRLFVVYGDVHVEALVDAGHPVVRLAFDDPADLGAEVVRWEVATALTGALLGINPFDQPDVEAAKQAARRALESGAGPTRPVPAGDLLGAVDPGGYLAILAYTDPDGPLVDDLERVRTALRDRLGVAVTLGIGPRYLHSTGQLHKGGPGGGVFLVAVEPDDADLPIPGEGFTFGALKAAQAAGDIEALRDAGRRVGLVDLDDLLGLA